jgi:hypothetical protein
MRHERFDVRRLAAVDMHALSGTDRRRRVIIAEFLAGAIGGAAVALFLLLTADDALDTALGLYALGVAANYAPLSAHALSLRSPQQLRRELVGVDLPAELRYYTRAQFLVFVPFLLVLLALLPAARSSGPRS